MTTTTFSHQVADSDLIDAAERYHAAVLDAVETGSDEAADRAESAEDRLTRLMREAEIPAVIHAGKLYVDSWCGGINVPSYSNPCGGVVIDFSRVLVL